jgi:hypothetical protein
MSILDGDLEPDRFGPAMLALPSDRWRQFVLAVLDMGQKPNYAKAARVAGFSDSSEAAKVTAHRLIHDARTISALHEEAGKRFRLLGWLGVKGLATIAADKSHPDFYKANKDLADRFGFAHVQQHQVVHEEKRATPAQKLNEVRELCEFLGIPFDPAKFLGANAVHAAPKQIEGDFSVAGE